MLEPFLAQLSALFLDLQADIGLRSALKLRRRAQDFKRLAVRGAESALLDKAGGVFLGNAVEVEVGGNDLDPAKHVPRQGNYQQLTVKLAIEVGPNDSFRVRWLEGNFDAQSLLGRFLSFLELLYGHVKMRAVLKDLLDLRTLLREQVEVAASPQLRDRLADVENKLRAKREAVSEYAAMARAFLDQHDSAA